MGLTEAEKIKIKEAREKAAKSGVGKLSTSIRNLVGAFGTKRKVTEEALKKRRK